MSVSDEIAAALAATQQAFAATSECKRELAKLQTGGSDKSASAVAKMADQLGKIRDSLSILEASYRAHPQHWSPQ